MLSKKAFLLVICTACILPAMAQKKNKKDKEELTPLQLAQIQQSYKKVFQDSLHFTSRVADTVAIIERDFMVKKRNIMLDRNIKDDEKEMMTGMLDADRDAKLGGIISGEELERFRAFMRRNAPKKER